jgi:60 kDa SS-A/Ro ribonucleoprotein
MFKYGKFFTSQRQPMLGTAQVQNSAGGYTWLLDDWMRLERFLVLGSEGGTFYISERDFTLQAGHLIHRCILADGPRTVSRIVAISESGRAPKNDPAIFSLAMAAKLGDEPTRRAAYAALPKVCRIGTHLMHFAEFAQAFGGWGRGMRKAVGSWFNTKPATELAYQLAKYQARDGWSNRDLLRLAHPRAASPSHDRLFAWAVKGELPSGATEDPACELIVAMDELSRATDVATVTALIRKHRVPRECITTEWLRHPDVWDALLEAMPMQAMIRNLATMTRVGLLTPMSAATGIVSTRLRDHSRLAKARIHPIGILAALVTYQSGRSAKGSTEWTPVPAITDALDAAFYASFQFVESSGKRTLLALDISGSMGWGTVAGIPGLTPRVASAAMALVTAATEERHAFVAFTTELSQLSISPTERVDAIVKRVEVLAMGGTDCSQPMIWAQRNKVDVDAFCIYTDNETWAGSVHPCQALRSYRDARGIPARLVVVGMTSSGFSIADPNDAGMLDVVGFDTSTPSAIADFARA